MRFQIPQFIEVEDRIFGPLTIKQFIYLVGGGGLCFLIYKILPLFFAILVIIPVAGLAVALAFYKVHGRPFVTVLESAFKYLLGGRLYVWRKVPNVITKTEKPKEKEEPLLFVPKLSDSKLHDLTWSLDVRENLNPGTAETMRRGK